MGWNTGGDRNVWLGNVMGLGQKRMSAGQRVEGRQWSARDVESRPDAKA
jgi:hypothetical protein